MSSRLWRAYSTRRLYTLFTCLWYGGGGPLTAVICETFIARGVPPWRLDSPEAPCPSPRAGEVPEVSIASSRGGLAVGLQFGASLLVWGVFLRTVVVWHITWSVNSLTHLFGYSNYETDDCSRNNWFVALLTVGEGWHNNHHHDPVSASNQHRWWEIDVTYYQIKLLERLGLAWDVVPPKHVRDRRRRQVKEQARSDRHDATQG